MLVTDAQADLRRAYVGGGPGVLVSSAVWFIAAWVQQTKGIAPGFVALFIGGMAIFPGSKLICRLVFRRENELSTNPLGMVALESTVAMIGGLFAAWLFVSTKPMLVFPLAAIAVGTHYGVFKTIYGDRTFWVLTAIITTIGVADIYVAPMHGATAWSVAVVELVFGLFLVARAMGQNKAAAPASA